MKSAKKPSSGEGAFDCFFTSVYGGRWQNIKHSLNEDETKVARRNLFFGDEEFLGSEWGVGTAVTHPQHCYAITDAFDLARFDSILLPYYRMDPASIVAARALAAQPGEFVLDMCAAPGGKSLVIMEDLAGVARGEATDTSGRLLANEMSSKRRFRLMSVFKRYLPLPVRQMVTIKGVDGSRIGLDRKETFDRILLDAPCSGERGLIHKKAELAGWKEKRSKSFGIRQYALLSSAFMALKPGGRIVYSTCSISPYENDGVIAKLKDRHDGHFTVLQNEYSNSDKTEYGTQFLPDREGWGPIFFSVIQKSE